MRQYLFIFFHFTLLMSGSFSAQAELPDAFKAEYSLYYDDLRIGIMERELSFTSKTSGIFQSTSYLTGIAALLRKDRIFEQSQWEYENDQLRPVQYTYHRTSRDSEKKESIIFDWSHQQAKTSLNSEEKHLELSSGIMDKLLYQMHIMQGLQEPEKMLEYLILDHDQNKNYQFEFLGEEAIKTELGVLKTYKYQRIHKNKKRSTTLWCAPEYSFLPVKVDNLDHKGHLTSVVIKAFHKDLD